MNPGDLLLVKHFTPNCNVVTVLGIAIEHYQNPLEKYGHIRMLCSNGELKDFLVGLGEYEVIHSLAFQQPLILTLQRNTQKLRQKNMMMNRKSSKLLPVN